MADEFTEVSQQGWLSRIGGSLIGALFGFILLLCSFPLEIWNEGRAIGEYKALVNGSKTVLSVDAAAINPSNNGKLIHVSGNATADGPLKDDKFGVVVPDALKLRRSVEMYQWLEDSSSETKKKLGGGSETRTTYSYHKDWSGRLMRSSDFHHPADHTNPSSMPFLGQTFAVNHAKLGAFTLDPASIDKLSNYGPVQITSQLPDTIDFRPVHADGNVIVLSKTPDSPQVGDVRVTFDYVPAGAISLVAMQTQQTFAPFQIDGSHQIELAKSGSYTADQMFHEAEASNNVLTWVLRVVGFLFMFIGLALMGGPISVLADILPFLGDMLGIGIGFLAFCTALVLSAVTMSIAWIFFRPLIGLGILAGGIVLSILLGKARAALVRK